ncbi:hypothetical protein PVK06_027312 [Gossypium arboreum]|uniref:Uncharacterized protein n=1 Tax=Gossypium arboreum TaxID=29729 RepID=A0ABR0P009_GOSAR|nr:hypothetical protein PVK06_027312 [Gossypium arboreum]
MREEEVRVVVVNEKAEEENTEKEAAEKESIENIVYASEFVGATTNNIERDGARPTEAVEVTKRSEDHVKPKEKKRKCSKDKKFKNEEEETSCGPIDGRGKLS